MAVNSLFSDYGWYILFALIGIYLLVQKLSKNLQGTKGSSMPTTAIEPDDVVKQQEALLAARMKMQEQLNAQAEKFKEKQKMLEEEKRKQKIAMWESMQEGKSYKATLQHNQVITPCLEKVAGLVHGDQDAEALPRVDEANSPGVFL
ncbi:putative Selenoprotein [Naja naja]|nr:putative Selenoprotein [Naja naja]